MLLALQAMAELTLPPLLIANHPSRSATDLGVYGLDTPTELRRWNNTAPNIAVGMAGAPGHQAATLNPDGSLNPDGIRGGYRMYPTHGGFDQFTAKVGGFWDSMIGEGRDWWVTANSDSHIHYTEGGSDFWPGEYSKTYVWSQNNYDSIITGLRSGNVFVTTGDLIDELYVTVSADKLTNASIGDTFEAPLGSELHVTIRFKDPSGANFNGDKPEVTRVDLILGEITGPVTDLSTDTNSSTQVIARFNESQWSQKGTYKEINFPLPALVSDSYIRVRGTNSNELEPGPDPKGESPWTELWFYSNPVRIKIK